MDESIRALPAYGTRLQDKGSALLLFPPPIAITPVALKPAMATTPMAFTPPIATSHGIDAPDGNQAHGVDRAEGHQSHGIEEAECRNPERVVETRCNDSDGVLANCNDANVGPTEGRKPLLGCGFLHANSRMVRPDFCGAMPGTSARPGPGSGCRPRTWSAAAARRCSYPDR